MKDSAYTRGPRDNSSAQLAREPGRSSIPLCPTSRVLHFSDLTPSTGSCDPLARTPYHKHVPVTLRAVEASTPERAAGSST